MRHLFSLLAVFGLCLVVLGLALGLQRRAALSGWWAAALSEAENTYTVNYFHVKSGRRVAGLRLQSRVVPELMFGRDGENLLVFRFAPGAESATAVSANRAWYQQPWHGLHRPKRLATDLVEVQHNPETQTLAVLARGYDNAETLRLLQLDADFRRVQAVRSHPTDRANNWVAGAPHWSENGDQLYFTTDSAYTFDRFELHLVWRRAQGTTRPDAITRAYLDIRGLVAAEPYLYAHSDTTVSRFDLRSGEFVASWETEGTVHAMWRAAGGEVIVADYAFQRSEPRLQFVTLNAGANGTTERRSDPIIARDFSPNRATNRVLFHNPQRSRVAVSVFSVERGRERYVYDSATNRFAVPALEGSSCMFMPITHWLPDGERLLVDLFGEGGCNLVLVNVLSGEQRVLVRNVQSSTGLWIDAASPLRNLADSDLLAVYGRVGGQPRTWLVDTNTGAVRHQLGGQVMGTAAVPAAMRTPRWPVGAVLLGLAGVVGGVWGRKRVTLSAAKNGRGA